jgi:tRNA (mo5U34)-methyltransferase
MFDQESLLNELSQSPISGIAKELVDATNKVLKSRRHGFFDRWSEHLKNLPEIVATNIDLTGDTPRIGDVKDIDLEQAGLLKTRLMEFKPWRKGPFELFGIHIDAEWRSDQKWKRLANGIQNLENRLVLDVGCGNGYYICRMIGGGARFVLGIEPSQLFVSQFHAVKHYIPELPATLLPLRFEEFPFQSSLAAEVEFDTVFSMGILYHRKSPLGHLEELKSCLRSGGELVLETLIVTETGIEELVPESTYAKMRNVWSIPSEGSLHDLLKSAGFKNIQTIDISRTTVQEQRRTQWMDFKSLADFLDPNDSEKSIEGYPSPVRIVVTAER